MREFHIGSHTGASGIGFLFILVLIGLLIVFLFKQCQNQQFPGGKPLAVFIQPPATAIQNDGTATFTVQVAMAFPLPNNQKQFTVRIDEDDYYDDTLIQAVDVTYTPGGLPYATGTFTLKCKNLKTDGKFDLEGDDDTSTNEKSHQVHAELSQTFVNLKSSNAVITCQPEQTDNE